LLLEEILSGFSIYWHLPFGIILILAVLFLRGGISGFLDSLEKNAAGDGRND
jgi:branched-chain amino acid transport system permease protein